MIHLAHSSIAAYCGCPEAYNLQYRKRLSQRGYAAALVIGSAVDAALEQLRTGKSLVEADVALQQVFTEAPPSDHKANDLLKSQTMVVAYAAYWGSNIPQTIDNQRILRAPLEFPVALKGQFEARGIVDGIIAPCANPFDATLYELKTTSDSLNEAEQWLSMSDQIPWYWHLMEANGITPQGALLDIVKKPKTPKRKAEGYPAYMARCAAEYASKPKDYFRRVDVPYSAERVEAVKKTAWAVAQQIAVNERVGRYPHCKSQRNCKSVYGSCRTRNLCWYGSKEGYVVGADKRYGTQEREQEKQCQNSDRKTEASSAGSTYDQPRTSQWNSFYSEHLESKR